MKNVPLIISVLALIVAVGCFFMLNGRQQKIGYVELEAVYNDFQMKKELEAKFQNVSQLRQNILDSLKIEVNMLSSRIKSESDKENIQAFQLKRQEYLMKEQSFAQSNEETTAQYKSQIWKQLSQYIKQFGEQNKYQYILGFDADNGALLYGNGGENVTDQVKLFVNNAYKGVGTSK
ncbi:MAG: OmpH family outer membrane protein [Bacteroidetes bacterium]|nr:OmpH family outer membrane protein [Bacteroidota bacterium]